MCSSDLDNANKAITSLDDSLLSFGDGDRDSAEALLAKSELAKEQLANLELEKAKLQKAKDAAIAKLNSAKEMAIKFEAQVNECPTQEAYDVAVEKLQECEELSKQVAWGIGAIKYAEKARDETQNALDTLKQKLAKQAKIRNLTTLKIGRAHV